MPAILNVKGITNTELKSLSTKLSFKTGEVFSARVEDLDIESNTVLLKMLDGWQFSAKLQAPLQFIPEGMVMFEVEGTQDGKLEIKIINKEDGLETPVEIDGFNSEDTLLLKNMLKHNMPLSKENVSELKTMIDFKNKLSQDFESGNSFITKYIQNKKIQPDSKSGTEIAATLKDFFSEFKKMSDDEILLFKENGIDLNSENIKSFNRIFKENQVLFKEITENVPEMFISEAKDNDLQALPELKITNNQGELVQPKEIEEFISEYTRSPQNSKAESDIINRYLGDRGIDPESTMGKKIIGELKGFITSFKNITEALQQSKSQNNQNNVPELGINNDEGQIQGVNPKYIELLQNPKTESNIIDRYLGDRGIAPKSTSGKEIISELKDFINSYKNTTDEEVAVSKENHIDFSAENSTPRASLKIGEKFYAQIENVDLKTNTVILKTPEGQRLSAKIQTQFQNVSEEFQQFKVEDIHNDMPEVKIINSDVKSDVDFKSNNIKDFNRFLNDNQELFKKTSVLKKDSSIELSKEVKKQINEKAALMKDVIKEVMTKGSSLLNNGLNDFKVLNTVSNQYYYMDIPINIKNAQYGCKLIIKDERSKGKRLDSKNIKLSVSVSTINLGIVDSYIIVKDNILNINMKCDEKWVKILDKNKEKLLSILRDFKYSPSLKVEKMINYANIVNTRDFFEDNDLVSINVRV